MIRKEEKKEDEEGEEAKCRWRTCSEQTPCHGEELDGFAPVLRLAVRGVDERARAAPPAVGRRVRGHPLRQVGDGAVTGPPARGVQQLAVDHGLIFVPSQSAIDCCNHSVPVHPTRFWWGGQTGMARSAVWSRYLS